MSDGESHELAPGGEPAIWVSMDDGRIVLRPVGVLDRTAIDTLLQLVAGARAAGATAVVDIDQVTSQKLGALLTDC